VHRCRVGVRGRLDVECRLGFWCERGDPLWGGIGLLSSSRGGVSLDVGAESGVAARSSQALAALPDRSPRGRPQSPRLASVRNQVDEREKQIHRCRRSASTGHDLHQERVLLMQAARTSVSTNEASQKTPMPRECRGIQLA